MNSIQQEHARIDRSEMTLNTTDFFLEHLVPKARLKFALAKGCRSNTHGFLTSPEEHIWFIWCDSCTVQWGFCCEGFDHVEGFSIVYLHKNYLINTDVAFEANAKRALADLSLLLVMQYVLSGLICRSVTTSPCARSLLSTSSPVL